MGFTKRWLELVDMGLEVEPELEKENDLQRLNHEWHKITEEKKKVIMSILDLK